MKPQNNRKTDSNPQTKIMTTKKSPSKMNTYLPSIEGRATSILSRLQARQESYPEGLITDAIQTIKRLEGIARKQNALRHTIQQLEGQLRIKDMQIAELKKQYKPPAQLAQERDEKELEEAWDRIGSDQTREQQCRDEMMGGHL